MSVNSGCRPNCFGVLEWIRDISKIVARLLQVLRYLLKVHHLPPFVSHLAYVCDVFAGCGHYGSYMYTLVPQGTPAA